MPRYLPDNFCQGTYVNLTADQTFLQLAPLAFDASTFEIWGCLLNGAKLVVMPPHTPSLENLGHSIKQHQVTTLWLTAGLFHLMVEERIEDLSSVRQLLAGGDVLSVPHARRVLRELKNCQLINGYGPTENTTFTCCCPITENQIGLSVPIGKPIANTQVYILDSYLQLVPIGVQGELHISGAGVARGYLNRPELTAEKFITNPLSSEPNSRLYKTGDLARYLPDGNIEYLGRIDNQVKIRGFRIELSEIEAILVQHLTVQENAVIVHELESGDKRLVACLVPNQGQTIDNTELRVFLKDRLPDYMIPKVFITIDTLPLTPNGKIDRRALSQLSVSHEISEQQFVAPRTPEEELLAGIWADVLGIERVGVHDNFFELGGHSLLAVSLMARIEQQLGKKLPLSILFQGPSIEKLAIVLDQLTDIEDWSSLVVIQKNGSKRPFFCVPGIGGHVTDFYELAQQLGNEQPFYGLQAVGLDSKSKPYTNIEDMATHYIKEIQTVQPQGPYLLGGHSFGALVAFEMSQQLQKQGHEIARLAIFDMIAPHLLNKSKGGDWDVAKWLFEAVGVIERGLGKSLEVSYEILQSLDSEAQLNYLLERFKKVSFLPSTADKTHIRGFIDVYKANCRMDYRPKDIKPTLITLFQASEPIEWHELFDKKVEPIWGWNQYAEGSVDILMVPGDHFTMMNQPQVQVLAEKLRECLEKVQ